MAKKTGFQKLNKAQRSETARQGGLARAKKVAEKRAAEEKAAKKVAKKAAPKKVVKKVTKKK